MDECYKMTLLNGGTVETDDKEPQRKTPRKHEFVFLRVPESARSDIFLVPSNTIPKEGDST
jgi:hypothetical protein